MKQKMLLGLMGLGLFSLNVFVFSESVYASNDGTEAQPCGMQCRWRMVKNTSRVEKNEYGACLKNGTGSLCVCGDTTSLE